MTEVLNEIQFFIQLQKKVLAIKKTITTNILVNAIKRNEVK